MPRLRITTALLLVSGLAMCSNPTLAWGAHLHAQMLLWIGDTQHTHLAIRAVSICVLISACLLMSVPAAATAVIMPTQSIRYYAYARLLAIGVGLLLLIEPFIVLIILCYGSLFSDLHLLAFLTPSHRFSGASAFSYQYFCLVIIATPICEEWFFRGKLYALVQRFLSPRSAISISTLAFAVAHANVLQSLIALPVGCLLGYLRYRGASLRLCISIHAIHNILFFAIGGLLITQPLICLACSVAGCWLCATGWAWRAHRHKPMHVLVATACGTLIITLTAPLYAHLTDRLWAQCVHHQINNPAQHSEHIVRCLQRARIRPSARSLLIQRLSQHPLIDADRQLWVLLICDDAPILAACRNRTYANDVLHRLYAYPAHANRFQATAQAIARLHPRLFIHFITHSTDALGLWIPNIRNPILTELLASDLIQRRHLLRSMVTHYHAIPTLYPLLRMHTRHIHPRDFMFLRSEYEYQRPALRHALTELALEDPAQAQFWTDRLSVRR